MTKLQAGRLLMVDLPGPELSEEEAEYLRRSGIRAVCLFHRNIVSEKQLATLCAALREAMGPEALIATDQEGGGVVRTRFWPYPPSALALGAAGDAGLTRQVGAANARFLRSVGINWNFAPVLDVNVNPHNPVIGDRSYGSDPDHVAAHGLACAGGLTSQGVAACAKHFPGHGDTSEDSHLSLPTVRRSRAELDRTELLPFRQAAQAGVPAMMTAHIVFPALDGQLPATLSPAVLNGLLRGGWGYDGVIVTDSMGMAAIDSNYGRGPAAVLALKAGADLVMALGRREVQKQTLDAVQALLDSDEYDPTPALDRLSTLARRFPSAPQPHPEREADAQLMQHAWARGLSTVGEVRLPAPGSRVLLVVRAEEQARNVSEAGLSASHLRAALQDLYDVQLHEFTDPAQLDWPTRRRQADASGAALWLASTGRLRAEFPGITTLSAPDLHLCLWNPYAVLDVPAPAAVTCGFRPEALAALRAYLSGMAQATGKLPLTGLTA